METKMEIKFRHIRYILDDRADVAARASLLCPTERFSLWCDVIESLSSFKALLILSGEMDSPEYKELEAREECYRANKFND